jgi:hypothetical protein
VQENKKNSIKVAKKVKIKKEVQQQAASCKANLLNSRNTFQSF